MKKDQSKDIFVWPDLVVMEFLTAVALTIILLIWALLLNSPLLEIANPGISENPSKAPWYFVGLQELLVYFDPWIAGVVIPAVIIIALIMIPYLDNNPKGIAVYSFTVRRFAVINFIAGFSLWWTFILIGYFLRGPDWQLHILLESLEPFISSENNLINLNPVTGIVSIACYFTSGLLLPRLTAKSFYRRCGAFRYVTVMFILLLMYAVPLKIFLRLVFNIRYVLVTPWFNI